MNENKSVAPGPSGVSRRTVVKGAAWAVPAIAVASSVPALAASIDLPEPGDVCRINNDSSRIYIDPAILMVGTTFTLVLSDLDVVRDDANPLGFTGVGFAVGAPTISPDGLTYVVTVIDVSSPLLVSPYLLVDNHNLTCSTANQLDIQITQSGAGEVWIMNACYDNCNKLGW